MDTALKSSAWLVRCALAAALVLLACGIATARFGRALQLPATTARDGALVTLNRYVDNPIPDVVLVGSSLTFRLKEEYFATPRLRNLALAGGSAVTGLQIVAAQRQVPRLVIVETNMLARPPDPSLVARYSADAARDALFLRPIRTAIAADENRRHAPVTHAAVEDSLRRLLAQPPSDFDNRVYLARAVREGNEEDSVGATMSNLTEIARLIGELERRGARVRLLHMPLESAIDTTRRAQLNRDLVLAAFPDAGRWLHLDVDPGQLRWADGVHLDERSAVMVSRDLDERVFSGLDVSRSPASN